MRIGSVAELCGLLRDCKLLGDPTVRPYEKAVIEIQKLSITNLRPLAKYVLAQQLRTVASLSRDLSAQGIDVFELECGIVWPAAVPERALTCPIVEHSDTEGLLIVDGLHRIWCASDEGRSDITCAVVRGATAPLVPLPVQWNEIVVYPEGEQPDGESKRRYRFDDAGSLSARCPELAAKVTPENFRYFLYRDFAHLGSSGIRTPTCVNLKISNES